MTYTDENQWIDPRVAPVAMPSANGGWAVTTLIFFWPLAFVAFSRALSVPTLIAQGRTWEAEAASKSVARLGKIAIVVGIVLIALLVVAEVALMNQAQQDLYHSSIYTR